MVVGLVVLMWLGTAHATPCVQRDLDAGVAGGQLFFGSQPQFEDGSSVRVKTQTPPTDVRLAIAADHEQHNEWIAIAGDFDPTAKYVGLEVNGYTMLTTPDQLYVCSRGIVLYNQLHDAKIFSIDRYGNRSDAVTKQVMAVGGQAERHYRCGQIVVVWLSALALAGVLLVALVGLRFISQAAVAGPLLVVSPILAENAARAVARRYSIKFVAGTIAIAALWTFDHPFSAIMTTPFAVNWLIARITTQLVVRQFDNIRALGKHDDWIFINGKKLYVPRRVWAKSSSLPTAGLA